MIPLCYRFEFFLLSRPEVEVDLVFFIQSTSNLGYVEVVIQSLFFDERVLS